MSDFLNKISSYNIFNYLLPGTIFSVVASELSSYNFVQSDIFLGLFFYYFVGLVISRLGSLLLEPALKKTGFLKFTDYNEYVRVCKDDSKLDSLSEANNMYRTLASLFICLLVLLAFERLVARYPAFNSWSPHFGVVALLFLFAFSWRKQTAYISSRIRASGKD
jgi:hypothetical protein